MPPAMRNSDFKDALMLQATEAQLANFASKVCKAGDCELFTVKCPLGYGRMQLGKVQVRAHRMALIRHLGAVQSGLLVRHKCRNKNCVALRHLEIGSAKDNVHDRYRDGTMRAPRVGEQHAWAKITREQARQIYNAYLGGGVTYETLGRRYAVSDRYAEAIVRRKVWREATADLPVLKFDPQLANKKRGSAHRLAVLTEADIPAIRQSLKVCGTIANCRKLATFYNVAWQTIYSIKRGDTWKHVV